MLRFPWWRHQMETFSALLAICAGNSPVTGEFPSQRPVTRSFDVFFFICAWINGCVNNREAGDLRRYRTHYDVTVMPLRAIPGLIIFCEKEILIRSRPLLTEGQQCVGFMFSLLYVIPIMLINVYVKWHVFTPNIKWLGRGTMRTGIGVTKRDEPDETPLTPARTEPASVRCWPSSGIDVLDHHSNDDPIYNEGAPSPNLPRVLFVQAGRRRSPGARVAFIRVTVTPGHLQLQFILTPVPGYRVIHP